MGRCNTKLEPAGIENKSQTRLLGPGQPKHCCGRVLTQYSQRNGSLAQAFSSERAGWCCIDPLRPPALPDSIIAGVGFARRLVENFCGREDFRSDLSTEHFGLQSTYYDDIAGTK